MQTVEEALAARQQYFDGLPPDRQAVALKYQLELDIAAGNAEGGMQEVIIKELARLSGLFDACLNAISAELVTYEIRRTAR